jgi:predicted  nucleic acid-binding Zn-ribbon protein
MKTPLILTLCLALAGCADRNETLVDIQTRLQTIEAKMASSPPPLRYATVRKREIETKLSLLAGDEAKQADELSPEIEEKIRQYEALNFQLVRLRMESGSMRRPPFGSPQTEKASPETEAELLSLSNRVSEAKAPVAAVLERRNERRTKFQKDHSIDVLIAEYAKDRFDLVVDQRDFGMLSSGPILYSAAGDPVDITDSILRLLNEKAKQ